MSLFNPRILDASIRDVTVCLTDNQKADVLLHALQHLPTQGCRTTMENAVQSLLKVPNLPAADVARAFLIRAKGRLAAGYRTSARQDLHSVLSSDPDNQDVKSIIQSQHLRPEMLLREPDCPPRFSVEIWREIALFLSKRDLRSLLLVPNALSRIASQLLFREIDLHFTATPQPGVFGTHTPHPRHHDGDNDDDDEGIDAWHHQRSADILTRILVDPAFAAQVKSLGVHAVSHDDSSLAFQIGMLMNALPKLTCLRKVHCSGGKDLITRLLQTVHANNPGLQQLSLFLADESADIEIPTFKHLTHFSLTAEGGNNDQIQAFLAQSRDTLHSLSITNNLWLFPADVICVRHLTQLEFHGYFSTDTRAFSEILTNGHQLESLKLSGALECSPSALFRQHRSSLPFLRHFAFNITSLHRHVADRDLCPAISEFLRDRRQLRTYHLLVPPADHRRIGFDASAWGVLPALTHLRNVSMTYPRDMSPALAGWLIPRSVCALTLDLSVPVGEDFTSFMNQLRAGIPPTLTYLSLTNTPIRSIQHIIEYGFPDVRVVRTDFGMWTVTREAQAQAQAPAPGQGQGSSSGIKVEAWPYRRVRYRLEEGLEEVGCEDAVWKGVGGGV
ncbi:hypothetical protein F5I97DRAFT_1911001 [Phlebopus sp. FC_14]|nr:hypothetical protein F5I97DRAFT_1911001 [Phlebopus sp. FC_14]